MPPRRLVVIVPLSGSRRMEAVAEEFIDDLGECGAVLGSDAEGAGVRAEVVEHAGACIGVVDERVEAAADGSRVVDGAARIGQKHAMTVDV